MSEKKCIVSAEMRTIIDTIYPVGSYFWSSENKNPSTFLGGTWVQVKDKFVLAAGDSYAAGSTGGEAQHTLDILEMPTHRHASDSYMNGYAQTATGTDNYVTWVNYGTVNNNDPTTNVGSLGNGAVRTSWVGESKPHNNMPPYITAYCWHRTA